MVLDSYLLPCDDILAYLFILHILACFVHSIVLSPVITDNHVTLLWTVGRLAQRIIRGDVPEPLMNRKVHLQLEVIFCINFVVG